MAHSSALVPDVVFESQPANAIAPVLTTTSLSVYGLLTVDVNEASAAAARFVQVAKQLSVPADIIFPNRAVIAPNLSIGAFGARKLETFARRLEEIGDLLLPLQLYSWQLGQTLRWSYLIVGPPVPLVTGLPVHGHGFPSG